MPLKLYYRRCHPDLIASSHSPTTHAFLHFAANEFSTALCRRAKASALISFYKYLSEQSFFVKPVQEPADDSQKKALPKYTALKESNLAT
jgi:hypothetical protein